MDTLPLPKLADRWALFLDLDGTLLDIAPRPDLVVTPDGLVPLLCRLERHLSGALAVVSGRSLLEVDALLHPWHPAGAGEHGAFCRLASGTMVQMAPPPIPKDWRDLIMVMAARHRGVVVEQKATAITVHFRFAAAVEPALREQMRQLVEQGGDDFMLCPARMAWEIRPRGVHKGSAVRRLMQDAPFAGRMPVFVGDDVTDEDGMREAVQMGGIGIDVRYRFPTGAAGVRAWLTELSKSLAPGVA